MRSKIAPIIWVLLLAGLPAVIFTSYSVAQRRRILDLDQRELARAADNLWQILEVSARSVANLGNRPSYICHFKEDQRYLELGGDNCEDFRTDAPSDSTGREEPKAAAQVWYTASSARLLLNARMPGGTGRELTFGVLLERVLDDLIVSDHFEYLFVADEVGRVLIQAHRGQGKRWLDQLHWLDRKARNDAAAPSGPLRLRSIEEFRLPDGNKIKFSELGKTTNSVPVEIAQRSFRLHLQPIGDLSQLATDFPRSGTEKDAGNDGAKANAAKVGEVFLGAILDDRAFLAHALTIDPLLALGLGLVVVFGLLTWPLIKFLVLAPRERFKFVDFYLLALSTSACAGLAMIVALWADNHAALASGSDGRLAQLAEKIVAGFNQDLRKMAAQLSLYDDEMRMRLPLYANCKDLKDVTDLFARTEATKFPAPSTYPDLVNVFWATQDGEQFFKMTTSGQNTPRVNIGARPYFRAALDGRLWSFRTSSASEADPHFFVQAYRSITTGAFETGMSMRSRVAGCRTTAGAPPNVAVLTTSLMSVGPHALPPDLGFMIIDRSGRVLYHSDPRRSLREELLEEVEPPQELRSILLAGQRQSDRQWEHGLQSGRRLTTRYRGLRHRFLIQPIESLVDTDKHPVGWHIITFRNEELAQTAAGEALLVALLWATLYFAIVEFVPAVVFVFLGPKRGGWLWPGATKQRMYGRLAVELAVLSAIAMVAVIFTGGWKTLIAGAVSGGGAGGFVFGEYRRWKRKSTGGLLPSELGSAPRWPWFRKSQRTAVAALALLAASIVPAVASFKFAWNQRIGALVSYDREQIQWADSDLQQRNEERLRRQFGDLDGRSWPVALKAFHDKQREYPWAPVAGVTEADVATGGPDPIVRLLPVYTDSSAALRFQHTDGLAAAAGLAMRPRVFTALAGWVLAAILIWWIRHGEKYLLLSEFAELQAEEIDVDGAIRKARETGENLIVTGSSAPPAIALRAAAAFQPSVLARSGGEPFFDLTGALCDGKTRRATLASLERSAAAGGAIVFSRLDPVALLLEGSGREAETPTDMDEGERRRWSDLLARFAIIRVPVNSAMHRGERSVESGCVPGRLEALYWSIWNSCSEPEARMLVHVAEEGFANPRDMHVVESLLRRGVLVLAPDLRPFSEPFREFIKRTYDRSWLSRQERPYGRIGWVQTRWMLVAVLVTLALFLLATQREALTPILGFMTALAGALAGVLKVISEFRSKQSGT